MAGQKIYLVCGLHVNFYHSWRGDRNDRTGFGIDSQVIKKVLDILDKANAAGKQACGTWDFDNFWSIENIMPRFAPDVLASIVRRVRGGTDEVILGNWNNGDVGASTVEEFREALRRTISNDGGSGVKDVFGAYSPVVRTQETMFTHGSVELYREQGVDAIALYYSAVPFDSVRNFVPRLSPNEMYNPLRFKSLESDAEMLMVPMYNQGDIIAKYSLRRWVEEVRRQQLKGEIPGNALIYINMDADGEVWTGIPLPKVFGKIPNTRGLPEFIDLVDELDYLEFGNIGEYIKSNPPVGEITVRQDLADGSFSGYSSWTEKEVNQRLWRISEQARWLERTADFAAGEEGRAEGVDELLYGEGDSYFENKIRLLSTTHFGMNSPAVHEERLQVAFHLARNMFENAKQAAEKALAGVDAPAPAADALFSFSVANQPKYRGAEQGAPGMNVLLRVPFALSTPVADPKELSLTDSEGGQALFDVISCEKDGQGRVVSGVLAVLHKTNNRKYEHYNFFAGGASADESGTLKAGERELSNGIVNLLLDDLGRIKSLEIAGNEFSDGHLLSLGVTYQVERTRKHFTPRVYRVKETYVGPRGNFARIGLGAKVVVYSKGKNYPVEADYDLFVFAGLPYLFVDADVRIPQTPCDKADVSVSSRMSQTFDTNWFEVMPAELRPSIKNLPGKFLRVWKHNYKNATNYYDLNFGFFDYRNRNVDSFNNHVTDGWVALGNTEKGLLISSDQRINGTPAYCPMRLREKDKTQSAMLNPFGCYYGKQFSQLNDGMEYAGEIVRIVGAQFRPTAPSFNGRRVRFRMMVAPYAGDGPDGTLQAEADLFSLPPAVFSVKDGARELIQDFELSGALDAARSEYDIDRFKGWAYADFLTERNKDLKEGVPDEEQGNSLGAIIKIIREGFRLKP